MLAGAMRRTRILVSFTHFHFRGFYLERIPIFYPLHVARQEVVCQELHGEPSKSRNGATHCEIRIADAHVNRST